MKKALKIIRITLGIIIILGGVLGYFGWKKMQKFNLVQEEANYIIENLDKPNIEEKFPVKYFPKEQLEPIISEIRQNCNWKNKDGKFVDFFTSKNIGGLDQTAFIYEYYLKCDSLRFILTFNVEDEPELMGFNIEPIETQNKIILFPEKQLKNR